ncbi:rho GTPase-activating protein 29-like [Aplochiton taeniatus]
MGDVDSGPGLGFPHTRRSRSFDNLSGDPERYGPEKSDLAGPEVALSREEEVDLTLLKNDSGVESALLYAKAWSKYIKDLLAWMEKQLTLDVECAKSYAKMAESARTLASQQDYMPFSDVYISAFKNDFEYSQLLLQMATALQTNKFMQPLLGRKTELDKLRKEVKELWQRELKKMHEADACVRKARTLQAQRREEHQKAQSSTSRSQEEQPNAGSKQMEKKRRLEEEALLKAEEAQDQYRSSVADAVVKKMDLANAKRTILTQIRELLFQCDLTLKAVTVNWFQMQQAQTVSLPAHYQALCEGAKQYEPGQRFAEFVRHLPKDLPRERLQLDSVSLDNSRFPFNKRYVGSTHSSHGNLSQVSVTSCDVLSGEDADGALYSQHGKMTDKRSNSSTDIQALRGQAPLRAWASGSQGGGMCSDSESAGGSSESRSMDSPTASPGDFKRRLPRTPSTGTMSSADDLDEREPPSPSDNGLGEMVTETASSPGPFRNAQMSKAAQTHKLRKLRAPSKCRECDSLVVFHGAECEECSLAVHKKCLETLAIQCGHKKLHGRLHLFGIDFALAAKNSPDGIPFIIKKCTSEIESRALNIKGIYRVNGAKSRVEKLCQAFENGKDLVELSDLSPHDISNVLKLYLRQLPEPLILYRYYNDFIGLAKESQRAIVEELAAARAAQTGEKPSPSPSPSPSPGPSASPSPSMALNRAIFKIRDLLRQLPLSHYRTLRFLIAHLHRVTEEAEENKMTASNLGIIFGPTLVKPRQADAEVSLSSLVDYPYQALMVELLVRHFHMIFDVSPADARDAAGQPSPRLTAQEKEHRLSRHSTSLGEIKESTKVYKRHSSVIPSSHILNEVLEVQPGTDRREASAPDGTNGLQSSGPAELQRSTLVFGRPSLNLSSSGSASAAPRVQLRSQRPRLASRPISMPLERRANPVQVAERNGRPSAANAAAPPVQLDPIADTIQEQLEPERPRPGGSSRVSTYYITPFIDTQSMQRRAWDRKYKHYDVTPRTAMIVANLPPVGPGGPPASKPPASLRATGVTAPSPSGSPAPSSVITIFPNHPYAVSVKPSRTSLRDKGGDHPPEPGGSKTSVPITFRAPRTLQPPPGTFYKPPAAMGSRARTLPTWTTTVTTITTTSTGTSPSTGDSSQTVSSHPVLANPLGTKTVSLVPTKTTTSPATTSPPHTMTSPPTPTSPPHTMTSPPAPTTPQQTVSPPTDTTRTGTTSTTPTGPPQTVTIPPPLTSPPCAVPSPHIPLAPLDTVTSPTDPTRTETPSQSPTSPLQTRLQTQDSLDGSADTEVLTSAPLSPPLSPTPSSSEELSPSEAKPLYQRLRPRRLQELEHREAHFV